MKDPCGGRDEFGSCVATPLTEIPIPSGVQLVGERGELGSRPLLYTNDKSRSYPLFKIEANDVRVEGVHLRGPAAGDRSDNQQSVTAIDVNVKTDDNPAKQLGRRVIIADNEVDQWTNSAVGVAGVDTQHVRDPAQYPGTPLTSKDAGLIRIESNYLHHNARENLGYGVVVGGGAYATIWGNVFDYNRHAVAADGWAHSGYVARFNYVLQGGFTYGNGYYGQHFDVHGSGTVNVGYGGSAGEYFEIAFNTIRGAQKYGGFLGVRTRTRPAFTLRGRPTQGAYLHDNVTIHKDLDAAIALKLEANDDGDGHDHDEFNFHPGFNQYNTDYSSEFAAGDFDGDGRSDVFVANGTGWFFSRGGIKPWEFLHASTKRTQQLSFADINNDHITDVLYRDEAGNLGYLKSGRADLVPLTFSPVPINELRFGDFDGDGLTDIFYTLRDQWNIWYGGRRVWVRDHRGTVETSSQPISGLLFGEFDDVRGTDIAAVTRNEWSYSGAATHQWARLNTKLADSFANAVAADFDGNGKTDIAIDQGERGWLVSPDGRMPAKLVKYPKEQPPLPNVPHPFIERIGGLKKLSIGRFDGGTKDRVIGFTNASGDRLKIWQGVADSMAFSVRSSQDMR